MSDRLCRHLTPLRRHKSIREYSRGGDDGRLLALNGTPIIPPALQLLTPCGHSHFGRVSTRPWVGHQTNFVA